MVVWKQTMIVWKQTMVLWKQTMVVWKQTMIDNQFIVRFEQSLYSESSENIKKNIPFLRAMIVNPQFVTIQSQSWKSSS